MRHLKSFKIFESVDRDEFISTIEDIILPLRDNGFNCLVGQDPGTPDIFKTRSGFDDRKILVDIERKINGWRDYFDINEIGDELIHIVSYVRENRYSISIKVNVRKIIDGIVLRDTWVDVHNYINNKFVDSGYNPIGDVLDVRIMIFKK